MCTSLLPIHAAGGIIVTDCNIVMCTMRREKQWFLPDLPPRTKRGA